MTVKLWVFVADGLIVHDCVRVDVMVCVGVDVVDTDDETVRDCGLVNVGVKESEDVKRGVIVRVIEFDAKHVAVCVCVAVLEQVAVGETISVFVRVYDGVDEGEIVLLGECDIETYGVDVDVSVKVNERGGVNVELMVLEKLGDIVECVGVTVCVSETSAVEEDDGESVLDIVCVGNIVGVVVKV